MSPTTLTSLAILKVNVDEGNDYLEYLRPFILQILIDHGPSVITAEIVKSRIVEQYGLTVPEPTIKIVLKRISRNHPLQKDHGVYQVVGELPNPHLSITKAQAERHISSVISGLIQYSRETVKPIRSESYAVTAICTFLAEFGVTCLRAYLRDSAIPMVEQTCHSDIVLVSKFVQHLRLNDPEQFDSFLILVQGHMLANALMCPDLDRAPKTYQRVEFYLDTPLIIRAIGADGKAGKAAILELISLLRRLGGRIAVFSHSIDEVRRVLIAAAEHVGHLGTSTPSMPIVIEARKNGTTRSDLLLLIESLEDTLASQDIEIVPTPLYVEEFQIDEIEFKNKLTQIVRYSNPIAADYDVKSVRSVYTIRGRNTIHSIEKCRAILVTSNTLFARAAWKYGQDQESAMDVSSVITDSSLANAAWLKAPMDAPALPKTQVLGFAYAALRPPMELLDKYMKEIERLEERGEITERDHQLLRSSPRVYDELTDLTLGDDSELTDETIMKTLEHVISEIKKEEKQQLVQERQQFAKERQQLAKEKDAHGKTLGELTSLQNRYAELKRISTQVIGALKGLNSLRTSHQKLDASLQMEKTLSKKLLDDQASIYDLAANTVAWICSIFLGVTLLFAFYYGALVVSDNTLFAWLSSFFSGVLTLLNLMFGTTLKSLHQRTRSAVFKALARRLSKQIGIELDQLDAGSLTFKRSDEHE